MATKTMQKRSPSVNKTENRSSTRKKHKTIEVDVYKLMNIGFTIALVVSLTVNGLHLINTSKSLTIEEGDTVKIDAEISIDGERSSTYDMKNYVMEVGSDCMPYDYEDQLIGHKKGEIVNISVEFGKDYGDEELAGKEVEFKTTIVNHYRSVD